LLGAAAGTVEQPYHHSVVFGKSGKHRANKLAAPVVFRDGHHPVPMQNISPLTKPKRQMAIGTFWFHIPHYHRFATDIATSDQALSGEFVPETQLCGFGTNGFPSA
jgi:hypothetical protein